MSSIIPIVSCSPPPLDDCPSYEDNDDWDDFTGFSSTAAVSKIAVNNAESNFKPIEPPKEPAKATENGVGWAAFGGFHDNEPPELPPLDSDSDEDGQISALHTASHPQPAASKGDLKASLTPTPEETPIAGDAPSLGEAPQSDGESPGDPPFTDDEEDTIRESPPDVTPGVTQDGVSLGSAADSGLSIDSSPGAKSGDITDEFKDSKCDSGNEGEGETSKTSSSNTTNSSGEHSHVAQPSASDSEPCQSQPVDVCSASDGSCDLDSSEVEVKPCEQADSNNAKDEDNTNCVNSSEEQTDNSSCVIDDSDTKPSQESDNGSTSATSHQDTSSAENETTSENVTENFPETVPHSTQIPATENGDDFDDFADFTSSPVIATVETPSSDVPADKPFSKSASEPESLDLRIQPDTPPESGDADDFDDFADFSSAPPVENTEKQASDLDLKPPTTEPQNPSDDQKPASDSPVLSLDLKVSGDPEAAVDEDDDEWGDDFADFQDAVDVAPVAPSAEGDWAAFGGSQVPDTAEADSDWAAFDAGPIVVTEPQDDDGEEDDDDFGDFEDVSTVAPAVQPNIPLHLPDDQTITVAISGSFPSTLSPEGETVSPGGDIVIEMLLQCMEKSVMCETTVPGKNPPGKPPSKEKSPKIDISVWNNLKNVNDTAALKYTWAASHSNQRLLKAIAIDTDNILLGHKKQHVPIFYQQAVLEPSRGPLEPSRGPLEPTRGEPKAPPIQASTTEVLVTEATTQPTIQPSGVAGTPQDIPLPEFDWSTSGLTNPLDAASDIHLDLDFLVTNDNLARPRPINSKVLQQEQEILEALEPPSGGRPEPPRTLQSLDALLAGMNFTPTTPQTLGSAHSDTPLGAEARRVVDLLPDLGFMAASVLMFPVSVSAADE